MKHQALICVKKSQSKGSSRSILKDIKLQYSIIRAMVAETLSKVEYLASQHVNNSSVEESKSLEEALGIGFPILNEEDFNVFEAKLQNASFLVELALNLLTLGK
nr:unnamed protein product [Callosobruchus analis]